MPDTTSIWLDCDTGHDDAFAILLAAKTPAVKLLGVSTVYGNAPLRHITRNTLSVLEAIGRSDVPVYEGAAKPFCRLPASAPDIHGVSGLDGTSCLPNPILPARRDRPAIEAMYDALTTEPAGTPWIVATGCLTNIALLFIIHPDLVEHVAGLSIMGGAIGNGFSSAPMGTVQGEGERFGNHTPWAEFNIYLDPESAASIFHNSVLARKTTLIPLDLTHQFLGTKDVQQMILHGASQGSNGKQPTMARRLFFEILTFFAKTYAEVFGITEGPPLHDPLAVAAAFAPDQFNDHQGERFDSQCGRTVASLLTRGEHGVRIPRSLDQAKIWEMLDACLDRIER